MPVSSSVEELAQSTHWKKIGSKDKLTVLEVPKNVAYVRTFQPKNRYNDSNLCLQPFQTELKQQKNFFRGQFLHIMLVFFLDTRF
jgi:hypothetical protein